MIDFDKIVKKLWKLEGKIVSIDDISDITDPDFRKKSVNRRFVTYKTLYRLKALGIITPVRQWLYFVGNGKSVDIDTTLEERYWSIAKKVLTRETGGEYFLSGNKALEIYLRDYSIPRKLIVYSAKETKNLRLSEHYSLSIRAIKSGKKTSNRDLYGTMKKLVRSMEIEGEKIKIACPEASILDALLIRDNTERIDQYLIEKFIKRSGKSLDRTIMGALVEKKYITSINRLKEIATHMKNTALAAMCLDIIKQEGGGCFISSDILWK